MAFVTDPDNLDRFQVAVDPVGQTVSVRGLGTIRGAQADTGISNGTTTFEDTTSDQFVSGGVAQGDILTIISGTGVGHYIVQSITDLNTLIVDRAITGTATDLTYKINEPEASTGAAGAEAVADGVTLQALYSFLKEEWRTLDGSLGNAADLIQFTFPLESITREQFEIGGPTHANWNFSDATTENLIRTGGWQVLNVGGTVLADNTGVITLGSLDSDAQVYYQQHAATVDPTDFVLTGVVNQSVNTYNLVTLADTGTGFGVSQTNGSITRNDGGNWGTDGYKVGGLITIIDAEDSTNNGTFSVLDVQDSVDGTIQVSGLGVDNAADTTMQAAVNKRAFLKLFVRKKARTYAGSEIADIGVSTIETIVNRFPLAHVLDSTISTSDGLLAGSSDGTSNLVFGNTTAVATGSTSGGAEGIRDATTGDGLFEFTHTGGLFTTTNQVEPGDVITFGTGSALDGNTYEIQTVTDADNLVLYTEPNAAAISDEDAVVYSTRTRYIIFTGNTDGVNADPVADDGLGTLTSATVGNFAAAGVAAGDYLRITEGGTAGSTLEGVYKIDSVATTTLTINISDNDNWATGTGIDFEILEPGMYLQYKSTDATEVIASTDNLTFADANPDTITRATGSFVTDGYVEGMAITVVGTTSNDGTYIIDTVAATVLTLIVSESLTAEGPLSGSQTINGEVGFVRTLNQVNYPYNWRLFGNGGTLNQAFEWIQKELRQTFDIDEASGVFRGDVNDLLMTYSTPTGIGLNMFIDNLATVDSNNATFNDLTGDARNFAFIAGVTVTLNDNLLSSTSAKVVIFFTNDDAGDNTGRDFNTVDAIIVNDSDGTSMQSASLTADSTNSSLIFRFDYDNNDQRGTASKAKDAPVTIVAIGTDEAQYVGTTGTISRQNNNTFALVSALERNYSNP